MGVPRNMQEVEAHNARVAAGKLRDKLAGGSTFGEAPGTIDPKPAKRIRQSSKPEINRLEAEFFAWVMPQYVEVIGLQQAVRLRLGNGIWYKPDVFIVGECTKHFYEVKGPHAFRGGLENLKVAASVHSWADFFLVWKDSEGQWATQKVLP